MHATPTRSSNNEPNKKILTKDSAGVKLAYVTSKISILMKCKHSNDIISSWSLEKKRFANIDFYIILLKLMFLQVKQPPFYSIAVLLLLVLRLTMHMQYQQYN
jgi:hypothetical protein